MKKKAKTELNKHVFRRFEMVKTLSQENGTIDLENRTVVLSFSSEEPVQRFYGFEVLSHAPEAINLERFQDGGAPVLEDHNSRQIGVVESVELRDKRLYAKLKFSANTQGAEVFRDIADGIRKNVSFGYVIDSYTESKKDGVLTVTATRWTPFEVSVCSIPADPTVGVGRALSVMEADDELNALKRSLDSDNIDFSGLELDEAELVMISDEFNNELDNNNKKRGVKMENELKNAMEQETTRVREILSMATAHGIDGQRAIADGVSVGDFAKQVLAQRKQEPVKAPAFVESKKTAETYSVQRAIRSLLTGENCYERELSQDMAKKSGRDASGLFLPLTRGMTAGSSTEGAKLVPTTTLPDLIELLYAKTACIQAGAQVLSGLTGNIKVPRLTAGATAGWETEVADITASVPTVGEVSLSPKRLGTAVEYSKQLLIQSAVDVEGMLRNDITNAFAVALDNAALQGAAGGANPVGIINTSGIGSVSWASANTPTYAKIVDLVATPDDNNALTSGMVFIAPPLTVSKLRQTERASGYPVYIMGDDMTLLGYPMISTKNMPAMTVLFGNFTDLILAMFDAIDIVVDPYSLAKTGQVRITANMFADVGVRRPASFAKAINPTT